MGIRMHQGIGYGLDLTRLDRNFISKFDNIENQELFKAFTDEALKSAEERDDLSDKMAIKFALDERHQERGRTVLAHFYETLDYDNEFAFEDKMLLYPLGYKRQWHRYGDLLDVFTYEAERDHKSPDWMVPEWKEKPGTLYPFVGLMRLNMATPLGVEEYWESCYMDRPEHKDAIPKAPFHLWHLIKHLRLTRNDAETTVAFLSLRPTLMRWWS